MTCIRVFVIVGALTCLLTGKHFLMFCFAALGSCDLLASIAADFTAKVRKKIEKKEDD